MCEKLCALESKGAGCLFAHERGIRKKHAQYDQLMLEHSSFNYFNRQCDVTNVVIHSLSYSSGYKTIVH